MGDVAEVEVAGIPGRTSNTEIGGFRLPLTAFDYSVTVTDNIDLSLVGKVANCSVEAVEQINWINVDSVRPDFDEVARGPITFPAVDDGATVVYRIIDKVNGRVLPGFKDTYNEGEVVEAPSSQFVVTAQVTGPENAFFEGSQGQRGHQPWWAFRGPEFQQLEEAKPGVTFSDEDNSVALDAVEGADDFLVKDGETRTLIDPAGYKWSVESGEVQVVAVPKDGFYLRDAAGNTVEELTWTHVFKGEAEPALGDSESPKGEETKDADKKADEKKDDAKRSGKKTLAKTGAGLGIAVLASGLVGSGAVLARRRNA